MVKEAACWKHSHKMTSMMGIGQSYMTPSIAYFIFLNEQLGIYPPPKKNQPG